MYSGAGCIVERETEFMFHIEDPLSEMGGGKEVNF